MTTRSDAGLSGHGAIPPVVDPPRSLTTCRGREAAWQPLPYETHREVPARKHHDVGRATGFRCAGSITGRSGSGAVSPAASDAGSAAGSQTQRGPAGERAGQRPEHPAGWVARLKRGKGLPSADAVRSARRSGGLPSGLLRLRPRRRRRRGCRCLSGVVSRRIRLAGPTMRCATPTVHASPTSSVPTECSPPSGATPAPARLPTPAPGGPNAAASPRSAPPWQTTRSAAAIASVCSTHDST